MEEGARDTKTTSATSASGHATVRLLKAGLLSVFSVFVFALWHNGAGAEPQDVSLDPESSSAWAWIGIQADGGTTSSVGFMNLNCKQDAAAYCDSTGAYPNVTIDTETGDVDGYAWLGTAEADTGEPLAIGWLNFDPPNSELQPACATFLPHADDDPPCVSASIDVENKAQLFGWARLETIAEYGRSIGQEDWGWVQLRGTTQDGAEFGVGYNATTNMLSGIAWSGGGTLPDGSYSNDVGLAWIDFSASSTGSDPTRQEGYISTEQGDVYVGAGITNPQQSDVDATFFIFTSTGEADTQIVNFDSAQTDGTIYDIQELDIPSDANNFKSVLGRIDFEKLTNTAFGSTKNAYGDPVEQHDTMQEWYAADSLNAVDVPEGQSANTLMLDGRVIVLGDEADLSQTFTLDRPITFTNASSLPSSGSNFDGSGVIVVNGNLTISADSFYKSDEEGDLALSHIRNLSSTAWIVRGDLRITGNASHLVGAFFVLGNTEGSNGTITTEPTDLNTLDVYGLAMARGFQLQRSYLARGEGNDVPSERFYYDGRVLVNTPPGLRDMASLLPTIQ